MKKVLFFLSLCLSAMSSNLSAHCQLPCGIYHDEMVFDEIDQYVETMYKGISVMNDNAFSTPIEKNQFIRWVINKEESSNGIATRLCEYFLQQKIKPDEDDTVKKLVAVHRLLFLLVQIKQNVSLKIVKEFSEEWEKFKLLYHGQDYQCEVRTNKIEGEREKAKEQESADKSKDKDKDKDIKTMVPQPVKKAK